MMLKNSRMPLQAFSRGGGTPHNGLYGDLRYMKGYVKLEVYERVGISRVEVYERVEIS